MMKYAYNITKCSNTQAYVKQMQIRSADQPMSEFYQCTKCGHTWAQK